MHNWWKDHWEDVIEAFVMVGVMGSLAVVAILCLMGMSAILENWQGGM